MNRMKKALSVLLALVMLTSAVSVSAFAVSGDINYTISNPYSEVNWDEWSQYKADLHCHTTASDGTTDFADMVEIHYQQDFDFLAITDHGTICRSWTDVNYIPVLQKAIGISNGTLADPTPLTVARYNEIITGADRDGRGMLQVPFTMEQNPTSLNNAHVNSFFADYGDGVIRGTSNYEEVIAGVEAAGGLSVINHPGEYTSAKKAASDAEAYNEDYAYYIDKFENLLLTYPSCLGIDINSKDDGRTKYDRKLWDIMLADLIPNGRSVYAIATSDAHKESVVGAGWTVFPLPEQTIEAFRAAMESGTFFACSRSIKNATELSEWAAETGRTFENEWRADSSAPPVAVTSITVDDDADTITVNTVNAESVHWIANGEVICVGNTIDLDDYSDEIGSYVRAEAWGEGSILYTQAFTLDYVSSPTAGINTDFFDFGNLIADLRGIASEVLSMFEHFNILWELLTGVQPG